MSAAPESVKQPLAEDARKPALKIWRYDVPHAGEARLPDGQVPSAPETAHGRGFMLTMPQGAQIVYVGRQFQTARIWALVNPEMPEEVRYFWVTETNHALPGPEEFAAELKVRVKGLVHRGTWFEMSERFTKHLMEVVVEAQG